jgi:hypothetical protein
MDDKFCMFCNQPSEAVVCASPECQKYERELRESLDQFDIQQRGKAFGEAIRQRCAFHQEGCRGLFFRWLYTLKALICVAFDWQGDVYCNYQVDSIEVAVFDIGPSGGEWGGQSFTVFAVATGWRNWHYEIANDGSA